MLVFLSLPRAPNSGSGQIKAVKYNLAWTAASHLKTQTMASDAYLDFQFSPCLNPHVRRNALD